LQAEGDPLEHAEQLIEQGRPSDAARFLAERIASGRGGVLARLTLVRAWLAAGETGEALAVAREAASLAPNVPQAVLALGDALLAAGHLPAAMSEFHRALRLDPGSGKARLKLGLAWLEAGEADKALEQFAVLADADVLIARAQAMKIQSRADAGYVRHLFDQFSGDYDSRMREQLRYQAPEVLRALADLVMSGAHDLVVLDLGCGTGLGGEAFAGMARVLDGIDLSPAMLAKARARGIYRHLEAADLETALAQGDADYGLILAVDTLCYLGDLAASFHGAARRLTPGGFFLFTVETGDDTDLDGFAQGKKRRWYHSETYLREAAESAGLDVAGLLACTPRFEANQPVPGLAVALQLTVMPAPRSAQSAAGG
jgi:predicted TPR repeat methyltransferase